MLRGDVLGDDGARADYDVVADLNIPEKARACTYEDSVPNNRGFFPIYPRPKRPITDSHVLEDDGISLEYSLSIDDDTESVVHEGDAAVHHNLRGEVAGIPPSQPSLYDLGALGMAPVMEAAGKPPHSVITSVHWS